MGLATFLLCWVWLVPVVGAANARAEVKDERGSKVGEATLQGSPNGVKISATAPRGARTPGTSRTFGTMMKSANTTARGTTVFTGSRVPAGRTSCDA